MDKQDMVEITIRVPRPLFEQARDAFNQSMIGGWSKINIRRIFVWALKQQIVEANNRSVLSRGISGVLIR